MSINDNADYQVFFEDALKGAPAKATLTDIAEEQPVGKQSNKEDIQLNIRINRALANDYTTLCRHLNVRQRAPLEKMLKRFINKQKKLSKSNDN